MRRIQLYNTLRIKNLGCECVMTYTYDKANRLIAETNSEENIKTTYSYDSAGNMMSKTTKNLQNVDECQIDDTDRYSYQSTVKSVQKTTMSRDDIT